MTSADADADVDADAGSGAGADPDPFAAGLEEWLDKAMGGATNSGGSLGAAMGVGTGNDDYHEGSYDYYSKNSNSSDSRQGLDGVGSRHGLDYDSGNLPADTDALRSPYRRVSDNLSYLEHTGGTVIADEAIVASSPSVHSHHHGAAAANSSWPSTPASITSMAMPTSQSPFALPSWR